MARFVATLFLAAFGAALAADACSGGVCLDVEAEASSSVGMELLQVGSQRKADKQIPGLSDIIDAGRNAINNVTDALPDSISSSINDAISNVTSQVDSITGSLTAAAATAVASALNQTLLIISAKTDTLVETCQSMRQSLLEKMNQTQATTEARIAVLEEQVNGAVGQVLPLWDNISAAIVTSSAVATTVLGSVGQEEIAEKLNASLSVALEEADAVATSLENVSGLIDSVRAAAEEEMKQGLAKAQDLLQTGLSKADAFSARMNTAFGDLTDEAAVKIAAAIPGSDAAAIDASFDSVDAVVKQFTQGLIDGPRDLLTGFSEATGMVEETLPGGKSSATSLVFPLLSGLVAATVAAAA